MSKCESDRPSNFNSPSDTLKRVSPYSIVKNDLHTPIGKFRGQNVIGMVHQKICLSVFFDPLFLMVISDKRTKGNDRKNRHCLIVLVTVRSLKGQDTPTLGRFSVQPPNVETPQHSDIGHRSVPTQRSLRQARGPGT